MWRLGHAVREIERSHQHVVVEETATTGAAWLFGAFTCLVLFINRETIGVVLAVLFAFYAMYASVTSLFIADRDRRVLVVKRRVALWTFASRYESRSLDRVYVRRTLKGPALAVRFRSGRSRNLTMSLGADHLERAAGALNHFL